MRCIYCQSEAKKNGTTRSGAQRFRCHSCFRTFSTPTGRAGNFAPTWKVDLAIGLMSSGISLRRTVGIVGLSQATVAKYTKGIWAECGCGKVAGHKGWCSFLYRQSARRQACLRGRRAVSKEIPGLYFIRECPECKKPIENALRHQKCRSLSRQAHSGALSLDALNSTDRPLLHYIDSGQATPEQKVLERESIENVILRLINTGMERAMAEQTVRQYVDF